MGANAQTTVQKFVDGAVLTAAQQNTSAATGVPVFATTVTRDAAFGGANKVLAEGQTCYLESTNVVQYYDGAAWATVGPAAPAGGMTLLSTTSLTGATTTISAIDQTYVSLYAVITGVTNATGDNVGRIYPNSEAALFTWAGVRIQSGTVQVVQGGATFVNLAGNANYARASADNISIVQIYNYASTTRFKIIQWQSGITGVSADPKDTFVGAGQFRSNTAITSLVFSNAGGNLSTGTVLLYGVK